MLFESLQNAQNGCNGSMLEIIQKFQPTLRKYAYRLNYEDAYDDILVEVITLIKKLQLAALKSSGDGALVNYINKAVYNIFIDLSKRHAALCSREVKMDDLTDAQKFMVEKEMVADPDEFVAFEEFLTAAPLTEYQRRVLNQFFYERLSIAEIAEKEGVARQNVNKAKNAGLKKLRDIISL